MTSTQTQLPGRPAWADTAEIQRDTADRATIVYTWDAPVPAIALTVPTGVTSPVAVRVQQWDELILGDAVQLEAGEPSIMVDEMQFSSVAEARKFAAAVLAVCDRLDAAV